MTGDFGKLQQIFTDFIDTFYIFLIISASDFDLNFMGIKTRMSLSSLGDGTGLIIDHTKPVNEVTEMLPDEVPENRIDDGLIPQLRNDLGFNGTEPEWVALSSSLRRYLVRNSKDSPHFHVVLKHLKALAAIEDHHALIRLVELLDELPMEPQDLELFMFKLFSFNSDHPVKSPLAILTSLGMISPRNWRVANWYLDLIMEVDLTMAEMTSMYLEKLDGKPEIYVYFLIQVAKTGRLEAMDKFLDLLPVIEKRGEDIGKEMLPVIELIDENKLAEAEMLLMALKQVYGISKQNLDQTVS